MQIVEYMISFFRQPPLFLGLIALIGLLFQRKSASDTIRGTLKTVIGMLILLAGVNIIIESISPLASAFNRLFSIEGTTEIGSFGAFLEQYGSEIGIIMLVGFIFNIIIARFTPLKTVFLTGNILFWFPMLFIAVGVEVGLDGWGLILFASIFHILYIVISPYLLRPYVKEITGTDTFTIGHTTSMFCFLGAIVGKFIGDKEKSTEDMKLPRSLEFFRDTTVTSGLVMFFIYFLVGILIGSEVKLEVFGDQDILTYSLIEGMTFAAGLVVLLQGARMMLGEIVPAFKGIADKLAPGSVPALDVPMVFPYAPTALLIGFVVALGVHIITIFILGSMNLLTVALVPLTIACYFDVAPGAIFANARGGRTAAIVSSALGGVILTLLVAVTIPMVGNTTGDFLQAYGGNDFSLWVMISKFFANIIS